MTFGAFLATSIELKLKPEILRVYVDCGSIRYGNPEEADLIKIHVRSRKLTFLIYDDFQNKRLPELQQRIKVNLRTRFVDVFDHSSSGQLLYFKERFVGRTYPGRAAMEKFSGKLSKVGLDQATIGLGPDKDSLLSLLAKAGLNKNLNPMRKTETMVHPV
jgi:DNA phosphorothioation-associated putative methyltransferase